MYSGDQAKEEARADLHAGQGGFVGRLSGVREERAARSIGGFVFARAEKDGWVKWWHSSGFVT